jgi:sigma-B regulation protein RsbU (phosphoserine phosphatase)
MAMQNDDLAIGASAALFPAWADWKRRLKLIDAMMRDMSRQRDPQSMVRNYGERLRQLMPTDRFVAMSRRGLESPRFRITRSSTWTEEINPWTEPHRLPLIEGGLLGKLIHEQTPQVIDDIAPFLDDDDPAFEYLDGMRSVMVIPHYNDGVATNMVALMRKERGAFDLEQFPEWVWISSLHGRATHNLVLNEELKRAYAMVEHELKVVADIQRSLLPQTLPEIPGLDLAAYYQTSRWAGGDYYDFFELPGGRWGILIADVSGHGTPAAVIMAITHSLAHGHPGHPDPPSGLLEHVNRRLCETYTQSGDVFVTAFYGIYDPATRELTYACAGHNPPRIKRCRDRSVLTLEGASGPPLGLFADLSYDQATVTLVPRDLLVLYTDGITEAMNGRGEQFGLGRFDGVLVHCGMNAQSVLDAMIDAVAQHTGDRPADDDRTLLVGRVI